MKYQPLIKILNMVVMLFDSPQCSGVFCYSMTEPKKPDVKQKSDVSLIIL